MRVRPGAPVLDSAFARVCALVHRLLTVGVWTVVACSPTVAAGLALGGDVRNLPLLAVAALPVGPAVAAALHALHAHRPDLADLHPSADFRRGYARRFGGALRIWAPFLALLTVLAINLTHLEVAGVPGWWAVPLTLITVAACLWVAVALALTALTARPARQVARRAADTLMTRPGVTFTVAALLVVAAAVTLAGSEAALLIAAPVLLLALVRTVAKGVIG
ncbi:hypothetical protein [Catenuloplanes atrovinosus]|uniref:Uncharacterized membrane protein YhaH (DUF805 family) n=1 Tax=Catenuloplanes atrovinosus TaxID=137266 RepID=A0AAE3YNH6_9ACTN|nr:hypothetical protein [Catenuloplanes atrovinosus]MDR7276292.1 uncharacterized membrane protein YhaH (DUF805 family) [Catenuloplanes atrovinosus]